MKRSKRVTGGGRSGGTKGLTLRASGEKASGGGRWRRYLPTGDLEGLYKPLKKPVTLRLDADILAWFKKDGSRYQTRINRALREVMKREMKDSAG